ncbi:CMT1A duplicated region transcript 4 protein isoform X1 [Microcebus murinus]|uniref:CMT1A duplicated region transcript 4 protein isoform X1 n=1 Tax=Microcebus murinus TaxID=30608 RepID=UPI003F6C529C
MPPSPDSQLLGAVGQRQEDGWLQQREDQGGRGILSTGDSQRKKISVGQGDSQDIHGKMGNYRNLSGMWTFDVRKSIKMKDKAAEKMMNTEEVGFTENIGLPPNLLEKHDPWPAYVTYTSPTVKRLIEKSKMRELECTLSLEENRRRQNKPSSIFQQKRRKSSASSGAVYRDPLSDSALSLWGAYSASAMGPAMIPEPTRVHTESRECPTANYNKIIFARKPMMRVLPYSLLLTSKEKHSHV